MQWFLTSHVRRYHKHYGSSGHVWQEQICRTNGSILQAASGQAKLTMSGAALDKTYLWTMGGVIAPAGTYTF